MTRLGILVNVIAIEGIITHKCFDRFNDNLRNQDITNYKNNNQVYFKTNLKEKITILNNFFI